MLRLVLQVTANLVYLDLGHNYRIADHPPRTFSFPSRNAVGLGKGSIFARRSISSINCKRIRGHRRSIIVYKKAVFN